MHRARASRQHGFDISISCTRVFHDEVRILICSNFELFSSTQYILLNFKEESTTLNLVPLEVLVLHSTLTNPTRSLVLNLVYGCTTSTVVLVVRVVEVLNLVLSTAKFRSDSIA
jgi:hypothetical protein